MVDLSLVSSNQLLTTGDDDHLLPKLIYAINHATEIEIAVSFIQPSGLDLLLPSLRDAIQRQEKLNQPLKLRILTSDYLHITHPIALRALLELQGSGVEIKIFEARNQSFHLKSYIFVRSDKENSFYRGTAFIGSNNISKTALTDAYEWCLRYDYQQPDDSEQARQFHQIREKFAKLFEHPQAKVLTDQWISNYISIREDLNLISSPFKSFFEEPKYVPNSAQEEALLALANTREKGFQRALVVLATGMGKTWLSAFDAKQMQAKRILFVAHREEILKQSLNTFAKLCPEKSSTIFNGNTKNKNDVRDKDMIFASVQTIGREEHLLRFSVDAFDYVVIDEFHHADAKTYRRVLEYFKPKFLLGLTATPERSDQANILILCHDNLVFERNLVHGIDAKILAPFHYYGIWDDTVDYSHIPWRNGKFDPKALDTEFMTLKRALHVFKNWEINKQECTLAFCVSRRHADYMAELFNSHFDTQGYKAASVHSHSTLRRNEALKQLEDGDIQVLFCVDLFNEGTDLPKIDTILMLRPTESSIIFLQQLGRGLRLHSSKTHLVVLDFIGNHSSFLNKQQTLRENASHQTGSRTNNLQDLHLPDGCAINIAPQITDFWEKLKHQYRHTALEDFQQLYEKLGHEPSAIEFYQTYENLDKVNKQHGSWFQMIAQVTENEDLKRVISRYHEFLFYAIQQTAMSKSFKMILMEAFISLDGLQKTVLQRSLASKSWDILQQYPDIRKNDLSESHQKLTADDTKWFKYWRDNPIKFSQTKSNKEPQAWFAEHKTNGELSFLINIDIKEEDREILKQLIQELIDLRLAQYVERIRKSEINKSV